MRLVYVALSLGLAACAATPVPTAPVTAKEGSVTRGDGAPQQQPERGWRGDFNGLIGYRQLDKDDWEPLDQQVALGLELDFRPPQFPLGVEFGLQGSFDREENFQNTGVDISASVLELYVGPRLTLDLANDSVHPYVGGGVTLTRADVEASRAISGGNATVSADDNAVAAYAHAGILFDIGESFHLGVDGRGVFGADYKFDFGGGSVDGTGDYYQLALVVGTHW